LDSSTWRTCLIIDESHAGARWPAARRCLIGAISECWPQIS